MNKITYTIITKDGDKFETFGFGGFDLTEGKTLAQSLVDGASKEKARKLGFYAACCALVDLARRADYAVSSKIPLALSDEQLAKAVNVYNTVADLYAAEKRALTRLSNTSERLHAVRVLGGRIEEIDARLHSLSQAIREQESQVANIKKLTDEARARMLKEEERVWRELRTDNEKKESKESTSTPETK